MAKENYKNNDVELVIIGAGPAGLTAAQYGARAGLHVVVFEQLAPGGQVLLINELENYPGIAPHKNGYDFSQELRKQAQDFGAIFVMERVTLVRKEDYGFYLELGSGAHLSATALIYATGAKHRKLEIPGEERFFGRGVSYCATCDGPFFKEKKIFVAGGGDAACDEAQYLSNLTPKVVLVHRRDKFRAQKSLADRVLSNPNIEVRFNTVLKEIKGAQKVTSVVLETTGQAPKEEEADAVFVSVGSVPQTSLIPDAKKDEAGYIITDQNMAASVPGIFTAGDVRASSFRQVVVAAGEGAVAAHSASVYIDMLKGQAY
ncbi:MAG: thioredoxin-disulfide reductase [Treponema sp.]|nr:thioredoxin-disulfide reductase [Treponema sp.]